MKNTFRFAFSALLFLLLMAGCASPDPTTRTDPAGPLPPEGSGGQPAELPPIQGEPVGLDFDTHLLYGNVEVETLENGSKRITLESENDETPHQSGIFWRLPEPLRAGDRFKLMLTAHSLEGGTLSFPVMVESGEAPWTKEAIETLSFGEAPLTREIEGMVGPDTNHASTHINLHLGQLSGVLEVESVELLRESAAQ